MIGILIVSHEDFGQSMIKSAELIVGECKNVASLGLFRGDEIGAFVHRVKEKITELDTGEGVLIFADLFGASPYNSVALASKDFPGQIRCIAGFNFPMLVEAILLRDGNNLNDLTDICLSSGKDSIKELFNTLQNK